MARPKARRDWCLEKVTMGQWEFSRPRGVGFEHCRPHRIAGHFLAAAYRWASAGLEDRPLRGGRSSVVSGIDDARETDPYPAFQMPVRRTKSSSGPDLLVAIRKNLHALADVERAVGSARFFKTGVGEYGEGDKFLGVTVPQVRSLVGMGDDLSQTGLLSLLRSEWHEERLLALLILGRRFKRAKGDERKRKGVVDLYLANTRWVNNWDLVDSSAPCILGEWLLQRDRGILRQLASSASLWEQRIAVLATFAFIRAGEFSDTLRLCRLLVSHPHDLMHKACGWMLREVGKRNLAALRTFLDQNTPKMPRTMLRYAIEKLPEQERRRYLAVKR
jgi:3-methyladenine DNA glycosylase AlkD